MQLAPGRFKTGDRGTDRPFPVSVVARNPASEPVPEGGGLEAFDTPAALAINQARLDHLASLGLPLDRRRVLDVGCGVGHLAQFFVAQGCSVLALDGREANLESLRSRYPGLEAHLVDLDHEPLTPFGRFEVVFCYGLLYHLENPIAGLRSMAAVCDDLLLLETLVYDCAQPAMVMVDEPRVQNQALGQLGSRPSPGYVAMALNRVGFPFVYAPREPPDHPDFRFDWRNDLSISRGVNNLRCVFVASRKRLENPSLVGLLDPP
jgi:SAM-dependent methyltransferase